MTLPTNETRRALIVFCAALLAGFAVSRIGFAGLSPAGRITLGIFTTASLLWIFEPVPLFVTSFVIVILEVVFLGRSGGPLGLSPSGYMIFIEPFFSSVIVLLLGGFVMAAAVKRYGIDLWFAGRLLSRVGTNPASVLLGMMSMAAFFSMWISNTATTALMLAVAIPIIRTMPADEPFRRALVLGIPFAANVGGIGTPIGSPPNAIAIGFLDQAGIHLSFFSWMLRGLPIAALLTLVAWAVLLRLFRPRTKYVRVDLTDPDPDQRHALDGRSRFILVMFLVVVALWLTTEIHGVPAAVVSLVPLVAFFGFGLLDHDDFRDLGWNILFIVGGGMSLGVAMQESGLSAWIVGLIRFEALGTLGVLFVFAASTAAMTTFISNSATANLLLPIVIGIGAVAPAAGALVVAITSSAAMILPVSTPPNAIAYGSREIDLRDMVRSGSIITAAAVVLVTLFIRLLF